jgi:hypothetical protein
LPKQRLKRWPSSRGPLRALTLSSSQFSARPALWCNGREIVRTHDDGSLDVRLTRKAITAHAPLPSGVSRRSSGDWIEIEAAVPDRIVRALESRATPSPARIAARQRLHRPSVTK